MYMQVCIGVSTQMHPQEKLKSSLMFQIKAWGLEQVPFPYQCVLWERNAFVYSFLLRVSFTRTLMFVSCVCGGERDALVYKFYIKVKFIDSRLYLCVCICTSVGNLCACVCVHACVIVW